MILSPIYIESQVTFACLVLVRPLKYKDAAPFLAAV